MTEANRLQLGRLERVPLREVWRHEAHDFTPGRWPIQTSSGMYSDWTWSLGQPSTRLGGSPMPSSVETL